MNQGDVLVIFVPFPDQPPQGQPHPDPEAILRNGLWGKRRPVVVVSAAKHNQQQDILVANFTSNIAKARRRGEYVLKRWSEAGLYEESALRPRLYQGVKADVLNDDLGRIQDDDRAGMIAMLKDLFEI